MTDTDLLEALDRQCEDYQAIYREGIAQRDCLRGDDLDGLNAATQRMRELMDRVRQRHACLPGDLPQLERERPDVAERTDCLRRTIQAVLEVRDESERAATDLMADTRRQLRRVGTGQRASRGYRRQLLPAESRFVDNMR